LTSLGVDIEFLDSIDVARPKEQTENCFFISDSADAGLSECRFV